MKKDFGILALTIIMCVTSLVAVVQTAKWLGIPVAHLNGKTFVFSPETILLVLCALIAPIAIILGVHFFWLHRPWQDIEAPSSLWRMTCIGFIAGVLLQGLNLSLKYWAAGGAVFTSLLPPDLSIGLWFGSALWFLATLVLNSVSEELVYRVFPLSVLQRHAFQPWSIVILVSVAFSAVHFLTAEAAFEDFLFRTLYGLLLCLVYLRIRSLWLVAGFHTGTNLLACLISGNWRMGGVTSVVWNSEPSLFRYSFSVVLTLAIVFFCRWFRDGRAPLKS